MLENSMHEKKVSATFQEAFKKHEFVVYYQPKIRVDSGELFGGEALVRWNLGDRIAPPAEFLPILEKEASICQLDFYVFENVCSDLRKWIDSGINPVRISSNFSKLHLKNKFLANDILAIMKKYNIDSKFIEIELTEVSDFEDSVAMQNFVNKLREKGISVSIDDFGTGSSTLNALTNIDANIIKLDKSLLDNMGNNSEQDKIVLKNMVSLMQELNKEVIAEGVETSSQLEFLKGINCPAVQGFVFDMPLPRSEFEKRLMERRVY
jgi:EAL domain-containing protein (putative c-di-GMP-specific phosphodiesterase class I)